MRRKPFLIIFILLFFILLGNCTDFSPSNQITKVDINPYLLENTDVFLDSLQHRTFLYFINEVNEKNGLVKDRSTVKSPASIAATGFAIPVWAVGAERGWITREKARRLTLNSLRFFWQSEQSVDSKVGYKGMYYHFLDMKNGERVWNCELSSIDTGLLLAGARFACNYFNGDDAVESEIRALADSLTYRVDWDWMTFPDSGRYAGAMSMGWRPEKGFVNNAWVGYNEALVLHILAAGSSYKGAEIAYEKWLAPYKWREPYPGLAHVAFPPLFGHHYSHMFIDFRNLPDSYMREKGIDYFENARRAVMVQQRYAIDNPMKWVGYDSLTWGLTACDGPGPKYNTETRKFRLYSARGSSGPDFIHNDDGTIAPTAAAASIDFAPEIVIPTLKNMYKKYGPEGLWGKYGFRDAFNPELSWIDNDYLGIDQGPIVLMIENWRNGFVWKYLMADPVIKKGLQRLGFAASRDYPFEAEIRKFEKIDAKNPPPDDAVLFVGSSSFRLWDSLKKDMAPITVINRGFGGSETEHAVHYFDRVVQPYNPRAIVFYEGDNDIAAGKLPVEIVVHFKEFITLVDKRLPETPVFYIAIKPSIARKDYLPQMKKANGLIKEFCRSRNNLTFVDVSSGMLQTDGEIRSDIFIKDNLHMNAKGYAIWAEMIKPLLEKL
ncbi:MAG: hypothetical protein DWQ05_22960 [Calditrichaeota bacterium]|nr:MAG: hypothetical protein DWQ05_22960 [Calditrichota bacterium]